MKGSELDCHFPFCLVHKESWKSSHVIERSFDISAQDIFTYFCSVTDADRYSQRLPVCWASLHRWTKPAHQCSKWRPVHKSRQRRLCMALILSEFSHLYSHKYGFFVCIWIKNNLGEHENSGKIFRFGKKNKLSWQVSFLKTAVLPLIHSNTHISFKPCFLTTLTVRILSLHCLDFSREYITASFWQTRMRRDECSSSLKYFRVSCFNQFPVFRGYFSVIPSDLSQFC